MICQDIAEEFARDKAEMRKYGRLLTADERATQWWQKQDESAAQAAYAELYAQQKGWIDNFPFQPRYHQKSEKLAERSRIREITIYPVTAEQMQEIRQQQKMNQALEMLEDAARGNRKSKMKEPDIETLNELKIFVNGKFEHLEHRLGSDLKQINENLKELRNSFEGNGKAGIKTRVSNLERFRTFLTRGGIIVLTCFVAHYFGMLEKLANAISLG